MPLINWDDKLSVKVKEIDDQHKKLIGMVNDLHDAMIKGSSKDIIGKILSEMTAYTVTHFATEEKYMVKFGYTGYMEHKTEHKNFVVKATDLKAKFDSGKMMLSVEIMNFLKDWLSKHILGTDKKYSACFNENGLK